MNGVKYANIAAAIDATDDEVKVEIKLIDDLEEDVVIPYGKNVVLNLNGCTLTNLNDHTIKNYGELVIEDSVGGGVVDNTSHGKAAIRNEIGAVAIIDGGKYTRSLENGNNSEDNGGNSYYNIENHGIMTINEGVVVEQAGSFSSMVHNGFFNGNTENPDRNISIMTMVEYLLVA